MKTISPNLRRIVGRLTILAGVVTLAFPATAATGYIYNNLTTYEGTASLNGGAGLSGGVYTTEMLADDLHFAAGSIGDTLTSISFAVLNLNTVAVNAQVEIGFWENNGPNGGPGTLLNGQAFGPVSFGARALNTYTASVSAQDVTVPADGVLWAGIFFDNSGTTATASQLDLLGLGLYNPPTIGSSADEFFQSTGAGFTPGSDPAGNVSFFGGSPVANFGFAVQAVPTVPEPSIAMLGGLSGLALLCLRWRPAKSSPR